MWVEGEGRSALQRASGRPRVGRARRHGGHERRISAAKEHRLGWPAATNLCSVQPAAGRPYLSRCSSPVASARKSKQEPSGSPFQAPPVARLPARPFPRWLTRCDQRLDGQIARRRRCRPQRAQAASRQGCITMAPSTAPPTSCPSPRRWRWSEAVTERRR